MSTIMLAGGQVLLNCHPATECNGQPCPLHTLTDHAMRHFPQRIRQSGLIERICPHGIGHPDPDGLQFFRERGIEGMDVHGCDGCCVSRGPLDSYENAHSRVEGGAAMTPTPSTDLSVQALALLGELVDPDDCWFDHAGGCQAHGFIDEGTFDKCPHALAKALLAARAQAPGGAPSADLTEAEREILRTVGCPRHKADTESFICRPCADAEIAAVESILAARTQTPTGDGARALIDAAEWFDEQADLWENDGAHEVADLLRARATGSVHAPEPCDRPDCVRCRAGDAKLLADIRALDPTEHPFVSVFRDHDYERMTCYDHDGHCCPAGCHDLTVSQYEHYAVLVSADDVNRTPTGDGLVERLRKRAEEEASDARRAQAHLAEEDNGLGLAVQQAREEAWRTVLALLSRAALASDAGGQG